MALYPDLIKTLLLPVAAVWLSVIGLAAGSSAHSASDTALDAPLKCEIAVTGGRYGHTFSGLVHARQTVRGSYELNIAKRGGGGGATINQSGDFHVAAGETATLGEATFGGLPVASVNAELTLFWNGGSLTCNNATDL